MGMRHRLGLFLVNKLASGLPRSIGFEVLDARGGAIKATSSLREHTSASLVALADTSCGYGTYATLPQSKSGFATVELKTNVVKDLPFLGLVHCTASKLSSNEYCQVWVADVFDKDDVKVASFQCTQRFLEYRGSASLRMYRWLVNRALGLFGLRM
ncbi:hypothetical protein NDN08_002506 [Rhodosorus marinus]|uniref:Uncharacterized protein n=1 Tax=Rhodosorus marinus TaxID=101924 RepID=A0AAV8UTX4_9RHOD|nr:hypothetical protein NDN08_002506 [Rhodosorus marinus]